MIIVRGFSVAVALAFFALCAPTEAQIVSFDFNSLGFFARDREIGEYMTDLYGSAVSTDGAVSSNDRSDIPQGQTDFFIATSLQLFDRGNFEILFEEVPIIAAQFEGHVIDATLGDDFQFIAFSGDTEVYRLQRNDGVEIFQSGWIQFSQPVDHIIISDSGRKDVGIDDFTVQIVPEPVTAGLLFLGSAGALLRRRKA
jgi:hypothetical protein